MSTANGIPMPGVTTVAPVGEENILYSTVGLKKIGLTFAQDADGGANSDGIIAAGTLVGRITASKKAGIYNNSNDDGTEVCVGILLDTIDVSAGDALANVAYGGSFLEDALTGVDAAALEDLNARSVTFGNIKVLVF